MKKCPRLVWWTPLSSINLAWRLFFLLVIFCLGFLFLYYHKVAESFSVFGGNPFQHWSTPEQLQQQQQREQTGLDMDRVLMPSQPHTSASSSSSHDSGYSDSAGAGAKELTCNHGNMCLSFNPDFSLEDFNKSAAMSPPGEGDLEVPWISHPKLKRAISFHQYQEHMALLEAFDAIMAKEKIPYIMCDGTLLGSYMMHDMIPWDNDLDIMVSWKEMTRTLNLFRRITKENGPYQAMNYQASNFDFRNLNKTISFSNNAFHKFKFYRADSRSAGGYPWKWPFIDIKFFDENSTHIWPVDYSSHRFYTSQRTVYPLHRRPFGKLWLPAPADPHRFLKDKFGHFRCMSGLWNHEKEVDQKPVFVPCKDITPYYPVVHRSRFKNVTLETLKLSDHVIQCLVVNETYSSSRRLLEL